MIMDNYYDRGTVFDTNGKVAELTPPDLLRHLNNRLDA
jgi:hypothetical protein